MFFVGGSGFVRTFKPVSHQPCGSRAPICDDKFLGFVRQPQGVVYYTARLPYEKQGRKAAATNFRHVHFLCDLFAFSERRTTAARHTRLSQDCCKTRKVFVRLALKFASHAFVLRQPQDYRKVTARLIARLSQECRETHGCSAGHVRPIVLSYDSLVTFA